MKSGTENKLKFKQLKSRLALREFECGGLLDALWRFTKTNAPDGNVGRFTAEEIAVWIDWGGDPEQLLSELIKCKWIDRVGDTLFVHDWWDHCEDTVHRQLAKAQQYFADGKMPKLHKLEQKDRIQAEAFFSKNPPPVRPESAQGPPSETKPLPLPLPIPSRTVADTEAGSGGSDDGHGSDGDFISVSEDEWPPLRDECNRVLKVVSIGKGGKPRDDCELIVKAVILQAKSEIPESAYAGALDHVKGQAAQRKARNPGALFHTALKVRCHDKGVNLRLLLGRVRIPPWLEPTIDKLSRAPPVSA